MFTQISVIIGMGIPYPIVFSIAYIFYIFVIRIQGPHLNSFYVIYYTPTVKKKNPLPSGEGCIRFRRMLEPCGAPPYLTNRMETNRTL